MNKGYWCQKVYSGANIYFNNDFPKSRLIQLFTGAELFWLSPSPVAKDCTSQTGLGI
jgi:hypothetical protein